MKRILDPSFRYTSSAATDLSKTFAKERKRLRDAAELRKRDELERISKVRPMKTGVKQ